MQVRLVPKGTQFILEGDTAEALAFAITYKFNRDGLTGQWWIEKKNLHADAEKAAHINGWTGSDDVIPYRRPENNTRAVLQSFKADERLWPYQKDAILWLQQQTSCILNCEMGLGKTAIAIKAMAARAYNAILVVVPAAAAAVWPKEVEKWELTGRYTVAECWVPGQPLLPGRIHICSWDKLSKVEKLPNNTLIVADEFQLCKNWKTRRASALARLAKEAFGHGGCFWALTGTPFTRHADDLWGILLTGCTAAKIFPGGFQEFKVMAGGRGMKDGSIRYDAERISEEIAPRLEKVMFRRTLEEVFPEMPELVREHIWVENDDDFDGPDENVRGMAKWNRVRQQLALSKAGYAVQYAKDNATYESPLIVFSCFREPIARFSGLEGWETITGDTSSEMRGQIVQDFQAGKLKGLAATVGAAGVGMTLTRSNRILFIDRDPSPTVMSQAEARIRRHMQTRTCFITCLRLNHRLEGQLDHMIESKRDAHLRLLIGNQALRESLRFADENENDV